MFAVTWIAVSIVKNYTAKKSLIAHKYLNHGTLVKNISLYNVYVACIINVKFIILFFIFSLVLYYYCNALLF